MHTKQDMCEQRERDRERRINWPVYSQERSDIFQPTMPEHNVVGTDSLLKKASQNMQIFIYIYIFAHIYPKNMLQRTITVTYCHYSSLPFKLN